MVADAIDVVLSARFVPGTEPHDDDTDECSWVVLAHTIATRHLAATGSGCTMRVFQKAGVSSVVVARSLRAGALLAIQGDECDA